MYVISYIRTTAAASKRRSFASLTFLCYECGCVYQNIFFSKRFWGHGRLTNGKNLWNWVLSISRLLGFKHKTIKSFKTLKKWAEIRREKCEKLMCECVCISCCFSIKIWPPVTPLHGCSEEYHPSFLPIMPQSVRNY